MQADMGASLFFTGLFAYLVFKRTPVGHAIADSIRGRTAVPDAQVLAQLDELRSEVDELRHQLAEAHDRLDFAERLLQRESSASSSPPPRA